MLSKRCIGIKFIHEAIVKKFTALHPALTSFDNCISFRMCNHKCRNHIQPFKKSCVVTDAIWPAALETVKLNFGSNVWGLREMCFEHVGNEWMRNLHGSNQLGTATDSSNSRHLLQRRDVNVPISTNLSTQRCKMSQKSLLPSENSLSLLRWASCSLDCTSSSIQRHNFSWYTLSLLLKYRADCDDRSITSNPVSNPKYALLYLFLA